MKSLSNEEINHIRSSVDIVDVVMRYMPLTKRGKNYFGVCPFHEDNDPSMSVSQEKQIFSCFSCHTTGNVFNFLMEYEHIPFIEAVKKVADIAGIVVNVGEYKKETGTNYKLYEIYNISHKFYQNNINTANGKKAKDYLNSRSIDDNLIKEFGIGFALKSRDNLTRVLLKKEYKEKDIITSALVAKGETGLFDLFSNRIMFPLFDLNGKIVGYSGRTFDDSDTSKYINSKETPIFKKGELLYNYYKARDDSRIKDTVIIMEGFMDVIRAYSIGIKNVVATMGTAFTKEHANLVKRLAKNVILCFDGDNAGARATFACIDELAKVGIIPKVIRLEDNLDPDDYIIKKGKDSFLDKLASPISSTDFKMNFYKNDKNLNQTEDVAKYINQIIGELTKIDDEILREVTLKKLSLETNLDYDFLKSKLDKKPKEKKEVKKQVVVKTDKYALAQASLIFYMLKNASVIKMYDNQTLYFPDENYRFLAREISYFYKKNGYINEADLITNLDENLVKTLGQIEALKLSDNYTLEQINDYIHAIRENNFESEYKRLTEKLRNEQDEKVKIELGQKILDLLVRSENDV